MKHVSPVKKITKYKQLNLCEQCTKQCQETRANDRGFQTVKGRMKLLWNINRSHEAIGYTGDRMS